MNVLDLMASLRLDSSEYEKGLDESEKKATSFGDKLKGALATSAKIGATALASAGTAVVAVGKGLMDNVGALAEYGDNIDKMSQKLGMSRQAYQEWDAIMQHSGTSIDSMTSAMKTLSVQAESGSDAFKTLGISQKELKKLSPEELFSRTVTALQNMESGTERTAVASKLLGKGAVELGALLNTSAEDTEAMRQRVHELGGVLSDEAVLASAQYQDSLQDMQTAMTGLKNGIVAEFLPSMVTVLNGLTALFSGDTGSAVTMITNGIKSIGDGILDAIPQIMETTGQMVSGITTLLVDSLPQFLDVGFNIIGNMINGLSANLPNVLNTVLKIATSMLTSLVQRLPEFIAMGVKLIGGLAGGLLNALPQVLSSIVQILGQMVSSFLSYDWGSLGRDIINGIVNGLKSFGHLIGDTLKNIASSAWQGIKNFFKIGSPSKLMRDTVGRYIPEGIAVGIEANADSVYDAMDDLSHMTVDAYNPNVNAEINGTGNASSSIVEEIRSLKKAILGMSVQLDTGATVGGLVYAMDSELGTITGYKMRGG